jgi:hypothetical protein
MIFPTHPIPTVPPLPESDPTHSSTLAHLELDERQAYALAFILHVYFDFAGPPTTPLQEEILGLREFLIHLLDERHVEVLLGRGA